MSRAVPCENKLVFDRIGAALGGSYRIGLHLTVIESVPGNLRHDLLICTEAFRYFGSECLPR